MSLLRHHQLLMSATASNNYAVFLDEDPLYYSISDGGQVATRINTTANWNNSRGSVYVTSGKWYVEIEVLSGTANSGGTANYGMSVITDYWQSLWLPGASGAVPAVYPGATGSVAGSGCTYLSVAGIVYRNGGGYVYGGTDLAIGDIVQVAIDADSGKVWFGLNGTYPGTGNPATGAGPATTFSGYHQYSVAFATRGVGGNASVRLNAGQQSFSYPVPAGFNSGLYVA